MLNTDPGYRITEDIISNTELKIHKLINNAGFIISDINRTIKFTIIENNTFFIEDFYIKNGAILSSYISYIKDENHYLEWINYIYKR
jgi:hypothetical protein